MIHEVRLAFPKHQSQQKLKPDSLYCPVTHILHDQSQKAEASKPPGSSHCSPMSPPAESRLMCQPPSEEMLCSPLKSLLPSVPISLRCCLQHTQNIPWLPGGFHLCVYLIWLCFLLLEWKLEPWSTGIFAQLQKLFYKAFSPLE